MSRITNGDKDITLKHHSVIYSVLGLIFPSCPQRSEQFTLQWHNKVLSKCGLKIQCFFKFKCEQVSDFVQLYLVTEITLGSLGQVLNWIKKSSRPRLTASEMAGTCSPNGISGWRSELWWWMQRPLFLHLLAHRATSWSPPLLLSGTDWRKTKQPQS